MIENTPLGSSVPRRALLGRARRTGAFASILVGWLAALSTVVSCGSDKIFRPPSYQAETNTANQLEVPVLGAEQVRLGECTKGNGDLLGELCLKQEKPLDTLVNSDIELKRAQYNEYTTSQSLKGDLEGQQGKNDVKVSAGYVRMRLIMQWGRWTSIPITDEEITSYPVVAAVDVGLAIRLVLDVRLTDVSADLALSYGVLDIAGKLATNSAQVEVRYDVLGTTPDYLPTTNPMSISSVDQLLAVRASFLRAAQRMSAAWDNYKDAERADAGAGTDAGGDASKKKLPPEFPLAVLKYYVGGLPPFKADDRPGYGKGYIDGIRALAAGTSCKNALGGALPPLSKIDSLSDVQWGVRVAYLDLTQQNTCGDAAPSGRAVTLAKSMRRRDDAPESK